MLPGVDAGVITIITITATNTAAMVRRRRDLPAVDRCRPALPDAGLFFAAVTLSTQT
jgi:hypothetical protein